MRSGRLPTDRSSSSESSFAENNAVTREIGFQDFMWILTRNFAGSTIVLRFWPREISRLLSSKNDPQTLQPSESECGGPFRSRPGQFHVREALHEIHDRNLTLQPRKLTSNARMGTCAEC